MCIAAGLLFGVGGASYFNLTMGKGDSKRAGYYIGNALTMLAASGVVISAVTFCFLTHLLKFFGSPNNVLPYAKDYVAVTAIGFPFLVIQTGGGHIVRADGSPHITTLIFYIVIMLIQVILLRNKYKIINLIQIPIGVVFGASLTIFGKLLNMFPNPDMFLLKFALTLVSIVLTAIGVFLYVPSELIPLPPEGFILTIADVTKIKFSTAKVAVDVSMVVISLIMCFIVPRAFKSIGIGTIVAAILIGMTVKCLTKFFGRKRDEILNAKKIGEKNII